MCACSSAEARLGRGLAWQSKARHGAARIWPGAAGIKPQRLFNAIFSHFVPV
jgi:hypothetical protein